MNTKTASTKNEDTISETVAKASKLGKAVAEESIAQAEDGYRKAIAMTEEGRAAAQQTAQEIQSLSVAVTSKLMGFASENLSASMKASRDLMACRSIQDFAALNASILQDCTRRAVSQSEEIMSIYRNAFRHGLDHVRDAQETAANARRN